MNDQLLKLYIEPTSHCNLSCKMCFRETWINESYMHMDMSVFYNTIKTMPQSVETVFFGGMGEPLFHPHIIEMITAVKSAGKNAELLTNGTLLRGNMISDLLNAGLDKLWISITVNITGTTPTLQKISQSSIRQEPYLQIQLNSALRLL